MALGKITIEGQAEIECATIICVCACGNHDRSTPTIELNFRDGTIHYVCSKCGRDNVIRFKTLLPPLPRTRIVS